MTQNFRQAIRLIPERNMYAALGNGPTIAGKIIDISMNGLSFEPSNNSTTSNSKHNNKSIHLFFADGDFYMTNIPCRVVYDTSYEGNANLPLFGLSSRCGVQFDELDDFQHEQLNCFLINNTSGLA